MKAAYFACIAVGLDPSVRNIAKASAAIRGLNGVARPVWGEDVRKWLAAFTARGAAENDSFSGTRTETQTDTVSTQRRDGTDTAVVLKTSNNDTLPTHDRHPRAGVAKVLDSQETLFAGTDVPATPAQPSPRAPRPEHALRDALGELIRPHLTSMTITGWRNVNGKFALDMVQAGVTIAEAVSVWEAEHQRTGYPIIRLQTLQERINTARSRAEYVARGQRPGATGSTVQTVPKADRR